MADGSLQRCRTHSAASVAGPTAAGEIWLRLVRGKGWRGKGTDFLTPSPRPCSLPTRLNGRAEQVGPSAAKGSQLGPRREPPAIASFSRSRHPLLLPAPVTICGTGSQPRYAGKAKQTWPSLAGGPRAAGSLGLTARGADPKGLGGAASAKGGAPPSFLSHLDYPRTSPS